MGGVRNLSGFFLQCPELFFRFSGLVLEQCLRIVLVLCLPCWYPDSCYIRNQGAYKKGPAYNHYLLYTVDLLYFYHSIFKIVMCMQRRTTNVSLCNQRGVSWPIKLAQAYKLIYNIHIHSKLVIFLYKRKTWY